ncbi:MAG: SpoIIE family protein phosphatase [Bryobacteraceae bacterium]
MATGPTPGHSPELVIDSPGHPTLRIRLEKGSYKLGRSAANDLPFPSDQGLSREHLVFECTSNGWIIRDLVSRNGTHINGTRLSGSTPLAHGDRIIAGRLSIRYDTSREFVDTQTDQVQFVDARPNGAIPNNAISADLDSALQTSMQLGALVRAGRELAGHCPLEELFPLILRLTIEAVRASRGAVMTLEPDTQVKTRAVQGEDLRISTAVRDRVLAQRESLLVPDTSADLDFAGRQSIVAQEIRSFLAVPLQTDERVIGLIYLDSPRLVREFTTSDLSLVTVMANIAAIRIEHARLIEAEKTQLLLARELERAAEIQRRLLPAKPPAISGLDLAGYNAPCRTVGGDYYDFLQYCDRRIALLIGDVSGKGMGAALLMSSLQAHSRVVFESPGELRAQLSQLNRITASNGPDNSFVTFCAVVLDPTTNTLRYSNAGHNAPLLLHTTGEVEFLTSTGVVLGVFPSATYEERTCQFRSGDVLLLFSDGVTEACKPDRDEEFGEERLVAVLRKQREQAAATLLDSIMEEISSFTGGSPPADDVTLVVARLS